MMGFGSQDFPDVDPNSEEYKMMPYFENGRFIDPKKEVAVDHDAYMQSPDGHKPDELSPTLRDNEDASTAPFTQEALTATPVDPTLEQVAAQLDASHKSNGLIAPPTLRTFAKAAGINLDQVVADIESDNNPTFDASNLKVEYTPGSNGDDHVSGEGEKWAFDEKVTSVFDKMLEASIPNYQEMRRLTTALGKKFIPEKDGVIIDIGASRGDALLPFVTSYPNHNYYAVEISEPMRKALHQRFDPPTNTARNVTICDHDLKYNHSVFEVKSDLILSVLTLMFIPIELRQRLLQAMYASLKPGGALILVEKCLGADSYMHDLLTDEYYAMKRDHGYTAEQISRKKMALEGVLVPVTPEWNLDMLKRAGFTHIETFWKSLLFTGFIAVKR